MDPPPSRGGSAAGVSRSGSRPGLRTRGGSRKYLKEPEEPALSSTSVRLAGNGVTLRQLLQFREHFQTGAKLTKDVVRETIMPQTVIPFPQDTCCYMDAEFMRRRGGKKPAQTF